MAEFLVYNKSHWMDDPTAYIKAHLRIEQDPKLTTDQIIKSKEVLTFKYNSRYQKGDVVEIRLDGFWTDGKRKGFGSHAFALVIIPKLSMKDAKKYMEPYVVNEITLKRRKYQIDLIKITLDSNKTASFAKITDLTILDKSNG